MYVLKFIYIYLVASSTVHSITRTIYSQQYSNIIVNKLVLCQARINAQKGSEVILKVGSESFFFFKNILVLFKFGGGGSGEKPSHIGKGSDI